jgi:hypothetical protein
VEKPAGESPDPAVWVPTIDDFDRVVNIGTTMPST